MEKLNIKEKPWTKRGLNSFIELREQDVKAKTGVFINPKTGNAWELSIQNRKLIVEVPNFSFELSPLSETKYRPVNTLINLEIEFEKPSQYRSLRMHVYAKGIKRATFFLF
jgi:hypothetical protein